MSAKPYVFAALALCAVLLLAANLVMTIRMSRNLQAISAGAARSRAPACGAIPVRFALNHPDCANALLHALNVTNVRFLPQGNLSNRTAQPWPP